MPPSAALTAARRRLPYETVVEVLAFVVGQWWVRSFCDRLIVRQAFTIARYSL